MVENGSKWPKVVNNYQNLRGRKISSINPKTLLEKYSDIWKYFNIVRQINSFAKIFVDFFRKITFGNLFVIFFFRQIYLDIHSSNIYYHEYIWIFILPIYMVTNILGHSFVQKNLICPTLLWVFCKNWHFQVS